MSNYQLIYFFSSAKRNFSKPWILALLFSLATHAALIGLPFGHKEYRQGLGVEKNEKRQQKVSIYLNTRLPKAYEKYAITDKHNNKNIRKAKVGRKIAKVNNSNPVSALTTSSHTHSELDVPSTESDGQRRSAYLSSLLPEGNSTFTETQRNIGSRGLLDKAIRVEITYNPNIGKTVYTTLGDDSDYGGYLQRIIMRFERDMKIPEQAYKEKLHGLLLYDAVWPMQTTAAAEAPEVNLIPITPRLYRRRGTTLDQLNQQFDTVLENCLNASPPPERLNNQIMVGRFAFFISLAGGSPDQPPAVKPLENENPAAGNLKNRIERDQMLTRTR